MLKNLDIGLLKHGPHAKLIQDIAEKCYTDTTVQAMWVGGSLASGTGDAYSDVDFRIAVETSDLENWANPNWDHYLPSASCGSSFMRFGDNAILHHLVIEDGTIVDFYIQDTSRKNPEPAIVMIACRNETFGKVLAKFERPALSLTKEVEGSKVRQFLVDYWIITHKEAKALGRKYDYSGFVGLYFERVALLRAWYMEETGKDVDARPTLHVLDVLHKELRGKLNKEQQTLIGLPSTTIEKTVFAIEAIREDMARAGRKLSLEHGFEYPVELEQTVLKKWNDNKEVLTNR